MKVYYFEIVAKDGSTIHNGRLYAGSISAAYEEALERSRGHRVGDITVRETK